jgi:hypothetical protein
MEVDRLQLLLQQLRDLPQSAQLEPWMILEAQLTRRAPRHPLGHGEALA